MAFLVNLSALPPCVLFEDDHLLVVNKPSGWNTHAPSPHAGQGIYDWLRDREPRWENLAILHRLDKETSGVLVFGKTSVANRSLARQFESRGIRKKYLLLTDRPVPEKPLVVESCVVRVGDRYESRPLRAGGERAETRFQCVGQDPEGRTMVEAEPVTGRTHQIRVHAAASGFPILGDSSYGGTPAARVFLHAREIGLHHPATSRPLTFQSAPNFSADPRLALRAAIIDAEASDAFRMIHGASDGWHGWYIDRLGAFLLSQSANAPTEKQVGELARLRKSNTSRVVELSPALHLSDGGEAEVVPQKLNPLQAGLQGAYQKSLDRRVGTSPADGVGPEHILGETAPARFICRENGIKYELSFEEGYSTGLFLDQRDNRRRLLVDHVAAGFPVFHAGPAGREVLNAFAYTCGFSVCAAKSGARVTSLDLSRKYLEWGRRNFLLNEIDESAHDFIFGDAFDWLRRLARKKRLFDCVLLDPPTFSRSKEYGTFRAEKDFGKLVAAALPVLRPEGVLFASTNAASLKPETFLEMIGAAVDASKRRIVRKHYVPQPPDFPITRDEPGYLKTVWLQIQ